MTAVADVVLILTKHLDLAVMGWAGRDITDVVSIGEIYHETRFYYGAASPRCGATIKRGMWVVIHRNVAAKALRPCKKCESA